MILRYDLVGSIQTTTVQKPITREGALDPWGQGRNIKGNSITIIFNCTTNYTCNNYLTEWFQKCESTHLYPQSWLPHHSSCSALRPPDHSLHSQGSLGWCRWWVAADQTLSSPLGSLVWHTACCCVEWRSGCPQSRICCNRSRLSQWSQASPNVQWLCYLEFSQQKLANSYS